LIDEAMSGDEDINTGLNSLTEKDTRCIETPNGRITCHKDAVICAAANTTGRHFSNMYTGTKRQDESMLNRFVQMRMDYDVNVERKILEGMKLDKSDIKAVTEELDELRKKVRQNMIPYDPSTRALINCAQLILMGFKGERAFEIAFLNPLSDAERARVQ